MPIKMAESALSCAAAAKIFPCLRRRCRQSRCCRRRRRCCRCRQSRRRRGFCCCCRHRCSFVMIQTFLSEYQ